MPHMSCGPCVPVPVGPGGYSVGLRLKRNDEVLGYYPKQPGPLFMSIIFCTKERSTGNICFCEPFTNATRI